ncbi:hypothetical protein BHF71_07835 [Vulcanibacillus modesticaldus]|uniref:Peptidase M23 n=1 Tax=Vulcanibacillus modesticaldus TaxID=337097 RepID=A0A1D2YVH8_9BACI|nr:M23 family metallopeptidase [Vulcanibacillus modesticaldus]OEF99663.1 hypothetical protein BHF71_07835 [Vulcanibacillus modesticaldus]
MAKYFKFTEITGKLQKVFSNLKSKKNNKYIKNKKVIIGALSGFIAIGTAFGFYQYEVNAITLYHVYVDGQEIGTVNDKSVVENWQKQQFNKLQQEYKDIKLDSSTVITFKKEKKYKGKYDNSKTIASLEKKFNIQAVGVELVVDGEVVGIVKDQATADRLLSSIKESYTQKNDKEDKVVAASLNDSDQEDVQVENIEIKEDIDFKEVRVSPDQIISENDMLTLLKKGTLEEKIYTVQEGDTISEIAYRFGLTTKQVYQMNPQLDGELIHIGDKLVVTAMTPLITVKTTEVVKQIERIPYTVQYKKDNSMFVNESKTLVKGKEGKKEVEYSIVKENGIIVEKTILSENVLEEPTQKVVLKGTKPVPSKGSGVMVWPTVGGVITSYFGPRWGSFHYALDIAGVRDYTIKAADNGKVIFAGWRGGYGKAIIIDHGNGIKTLYAHLNSINVAVGDKIAKGQKIAIMGSTGRSTGTHLHFEVRVNGVKKNPLNYIGK